MTSDVEKARVLVEADWYDGPAAGVVLLNGAPHRFRRLLDDDDEFSLAYVVWPIDQAELGLELEAYAMFVERHERWEAGQRSIETHAASGGINTRYYELKELLEPLRAAVPANARRARANWEWRGAKSLYERDGPGYTMTFQFPDGGS